jgi:hypothetical protein
MRFVVSLVVDSVESVISLGLSGINAGEAEAEARNHSSTTGLSTACMGHVNGSETTHLQDNLTAMGTCSLVRGEEMCSGESGGSDKDHGICLLG